MDTYSIILLHCFLIQTYLDINFDTQTGSENTLASQNFFTIFSDIRSARQNI